MPGPAITGPSSSWAAHIPTFFLRSLILRSLILGTLIASTVVLCLLQADAGFAAQNPPPQATATQGAQPQNPPAGNPPAQAQPPSPQIPSENGTFVIRKNVDEVLLHATVIDDKGHIVTDLDKSAFTVFEDGKQQEIVSFRHEDIPVAMGILIEDVYKRQDKKYFADFGWSLQKGSILFPAGTCATGLHPEPVAAKKARQKFPDGSGWDDAA